ncbi:MAG: Ger(x)C family spore germination protein [Clostridiaceae bacterium]|nr:Ger(x)C family spore germination protein [Clostridiaceae bacterium]
MSRYFFRTHKQESKATAGLFRRTRVAVRRAVLLALCVVVFLNLSGCWSRRELNTLAIVLGTGFDLGEEPDTVTITAQVVKPEEIKSGGSSGPGGGTSGKVYTNIQNTDKSPLSAIRGAVHAVKRRLYFPHNQVLIFGSELAKKDISEGLDTFMRDNETRMNVYIVIAKGRAEDILSEEPQIEKIPAVHIAGLLENQKAVSETVVVTLRDFSIAMLSGSMCPVAPMVELYETNEGQMKARLDSTAVFKNGQMIGELDKAQTRGLLYITGKTQSGAITVDTKWGQVTLELVHSQSELKAVKLSDGTIQMQLKINEDGYIESNETQKEMQKDSDIEMLKELEQEAIRTDVQQALYTARALQADVFGFGEIIRREYPDDWETMKGTWDIEFSKIKLNVKIEIELRSTGALTAPVTSGGAE